MSPALPQATRYFASLILALICGTDVAAELFVSSFSGNRVLRFSETNGAPIGTGVFVTANSGGLNLPHGLAVGPDANLYVASAGSDAVLRYNGTNGAFIDAFVPSGGGGLDYPVWLEFRGPFLYVSSQLNDRVLRYNATNGAFVDTFVPAGSGGLDGPSGMAFGPDGHLYVVGRFGNNVLRYNGTNGAFIDAIVPVGQLSQPFGIKFGPGGNFYVASGNDNKIARFAVNGTYLGDFVASGAGSLSLPIDLAFGPNGDLFVASFNNNKVARFNGASGSYVADFVSSGSAGIAGPNFMMFRAARTYGTNIPGIGPVGPIEQRHLGLTFTEGPAADANGNVYFTDVQANRIYRSDTQGILSIFMTNSRACNGLMFDQRGRIVACQRDERRIITINVATTNITSLASNFGGRAFFGPNDVVVDGYGGAYFTDPNYNSGQTGPTQSVYYVSAGGEVSQVASNLSRPNGVILSVDEQTLFVVLAGVARLMRYPIVSPGLVGAAVTNNIPATGDGMTIDTAGNLYLCQPSANRVLVLSPAGVTLGSIPFPESPANCTFGGKDMKTLFVTARTSVYLCPMEATGHRFAWNPFSYADFQTRFFGATNAANADAAADPDGDGAPNQLEYLVRSHPLCSGDAWKVSLHKTNSTVELSFLQVAGRGFDVELNGSVFPWGWTSLVAPGNPPAITATNRSLTISHASDPASNSFYRVRVFEP